MTSIIWSNSFLHASVTGIFFPGGVARSYTNHHPGWLGHPVAGQRGTFNRIIADIEE